MNKEEKQVLQEKYKEQRRAMWGGKRANSHDSEEGTEEESEAQTGPVIASGDEADSAKSPTDTTSSDSQAAPSPVREEASQEESSVQPDLHSEPSQASDGEARGFWEGSQTRGGRRVLTWKLALVVIGIVIVLIGVGVWLGYLWALGWDITFFIGLLWRQGTLYVWAFGWDIGLLVR